MKKTEKLLALLLVLLLACAGCSPSDPGAENSDKGTPSASDVAFAHPERAGGVPGPGAGRQGEV